MTISAEAVLAIASKLRTLKNGVRQSNIGTIPGRDMLTVIEEVLALLDTARTEEPRA